MAVSSQPLALVTTALATASAKPSRARLPTSPGQIQKECGTVQIFRTLFHFATRIDDTVYYHLTDPTSTSMTVVDEAGASGSLTYDAYGGVLANTLPTEMSAALANQGTLPDPDTGLVYQGDGRYYDPALGRPLQPNPFGGVPTVPQSLNRYAATSLGQPGVRSLHVALRTETLPTCRV